MAVFGCIGRPQGNSALEGKGTFLNRAADPGWDRARVYEPNPPAA
jgi:hypothetical protein